MNIVVLCSGSGTNLQIIIDKVKSGYIPARIAIVISDKADAFALERAKRARIETLFLNPKNFKNREEFDKELVKKLRDKDVDIVVMAGFIRLVTPYFIDSYRGRIINIHPSLLPAFKGAHGIKDALEYGVKVTGATAHLVEMELDSGPIIMQEALEVKEDDTEETLAQRVHEAEYKIFPEAIKLLVEGRVKIEGRRVKIS